MDWVSCIESVSEVCDCVDGVEPFGNGFSCSSTLVMALWMCGIFFMPPFVASLLFVCDWLSCNSRGYASLSAGMLTALSRVSSRSRA